MIKPTKIIFDKRKSIEVEKGEILVIPKNTKYAFYGKFDAILVDCPAFNPKDDIIYKEELKNE